MKVIWFSTISNEYGYSSKNEFENICQTSLIPGELVKVEELRDIPNHIMDQLVDEMNKHNAQPIH